MITRILIRVKVLQTLYSYMLTKPYRTMDQAIKELDNAFEKSHELYYYLLRLLVELTDLQDRRLDEAKHKFKPTDEELNPDTRFIDNRLVQALRDNAQFTRYCRNRLIAWDDLLFLRAMLDRILQSEYYVAYMALDQATLADDCELWIHLLQRVIVTDEMFEDKTEAMSVYWSCEDIRIMSDFAAKTIRKIQEGDPDPLIPMFRTDDDQEYGEKLFKRTVQQMDENNILIDSLVRHDRWEHNRIALMDRLIMCAAISEMKCFDSIPTNVTLNEYIELAKIFSTPNSGQFVNGVLNAAVNSLKERGRVTKQ
ncbi:MAG: transcription antitermination protein NusB [Muribaculaceae bacterium]|nr:transcription antitermination protein NusB [Muribaculaceae bacterium]